MKWGVGVRVATDGTILVAGIDEELGDLVEPQTSSEMERCVAVVGEVRILADLWIVFHNAFHERKVIEVDGPAKAD